MSNTCMNDKQPSSYVEVFEKSVLIQPNRRVFDYIDTYQLAYKSKRGVDYETICVLYNR